MDHVRKVICAQPWETMPYTGRGVTTALLDTGFAMHPDIGRRLAAFKDFVKKERIPYDDSGHGTHVAGCLCGSGICSGGKYRGIATNCSILACKVLDEKGDGDIEHMIEAICYVLDSRKLYHTRIINISVGLGNNGNEQKLSELLGWLEEAWHAGLFVVVAAGNGGPKDNSISPLGLSESVVSVGCHSGQRGNSQTQNCESYSGRGPAGNRVKKPDIVAPGSNIISCNADFRKMPWGHIKNPYTAKSGTSMAVPAVSGAAALLWEKYPKYTNEQIKERILMSAKDLEEAWGKQGWGMLQVGKALNG
ncbi:MAG: S8 family peptidase [Lachnospiraceae bacterium]|nr:S8 family peptidase [Lachnospiraceae bacterium]